MSVPVKIVIVYHSGYGHTVKIAEAVARGAAAINGASVELVTAERAPRRWERLGYRCGVAPQAADSR